MNVLLCMPKYIDIYHPGCNGGGAWGWMLEKQFERIGWKVTFLNSFEYDYVPHWLIDSQDVIIFRHSYQTNFQRYKDIVSKASKGTLIIHNFIDRLADENWESFKVCKETDIWIAQNEAHKKLAERVGYKSYLLHYPLDINAFPSKPRMNKNLLYIGRFCPQKGIETLLRSFKIIRQKHPDATLTLKGAWSWGEWGDRQADGYLKYIEYMESIIKEAGGINIINSWTEPNTVANYYKDSSVMVFPVNGEPYGAPQVEAQTAAMPVITSDHPSQVEKTEIGIDGFCLERRWKDILGRYDLPHPEDIAEKVNFFFEDMERIKSFGTAARAKAEEMYDENKVITKLVDLLIAELNKKRNG